MNTGKDEFLKAYLKNWAANQPSPANGKARLLLKAASMNYQVARPISFTAEARNYIPREFCLPAFSGGPADSLFSRIWLAHMSMPSLHLI